MTTATKTPTEEPTATAEPATTEEPNTFQHRNLASALAAFQMELPSIAKGKEGDAGKYTYWYASLEDISPVVLKLLGKHGLAWSTSPTMMGEAFVLRYVLAHEGGEDSIEGVYPLPAASTAPQQLGSAITYARRYALCAVTGVAPGGDDDDAQRTGDGSTDAAPRPAATPKQSAIASPAVSRDWAGMIAKAADRRELKTMWEAAGGELGMPFDPQYAASMTALKERWPDLADAPANVSVGKLMNAVRARLPEVVAEAEPTETADVAEDRPAALDESIDSWPTAEPGSGGA